MLLVLVLARGLGLDLALALALALAFALALVGAISNAAPPSGGQGFCRKQKNPAIKQGTSCIEPKTSRETAIGR